MRFKATLTPSGPKSKLNRRRLTRTSSPPRHPAQGCSMISRQITPTTRLSSESTRKSLMTTQIIFKDHWTRSQKFQLKSRRSPRSLLTARLSETRSMRNTRLKWRTIMSRLLQLMRPTPWLSTFKVVLLSFKWKEDLTKFCPGSRASREVLRSYSNLYCPWWLNYPRSRT